MHLRSLELFGFKSFADKTEIVFERGLTAIVGPNGCGKSNIVDGIRWALGEQSARSLRGGAMTDVIFNGGGRRGPVNFCEVTLTFDNSDRALAVERDEVRVTRRLYRSGEGEYLVNGKPSRLKDIRELLLDTGAGASAATFVEQGKIDALLHASAEERRHVLEEAAGIGKYKIRKKETLHRLEEVSNDRTRLADLLSEVSARHEEVKQQAEKAGRFVEVRERLRAVRTLLARHKRAGFEKRIAEGGARAEKAKADAAAEGARAARLADEAAKLAEEKRTRETALRNAELEIRDLAAAIEGRKREIEQEDRREKELRDDAASTERRLKEAGKGVAALEKEIEQAKKALAELSKKDEGIGERVEGLERRAAELDKVAAAAAAEVEHLKRDLLARMQEESRARNRLAELDARSKVLAGREERLTRKRAEVNAALAEREAENEGLARTASAAEARAAELESDLRLAAARREEAEKALRAAEEQFLEARRRHGDVEARLQALRTLEHEGEGLEPGVKAVLDASRRVVLPAANTAERRGSAGVPEAPAGPETGSPAIVGPLADLLAVERAHAAAVDAALGPRAQWVLVKTREAAIGTLRWLAKANRGRAGIVALEEAVGAGAGTGTGTKAELASHPMPHCPYVLPEHDRGVNAGAQGGTRPDVTHDGFVGWAADLAAPRDAARPLVERLLAGTAVVRELEAAIALAGSPGIARAVTLAGEVVDPAGALEAGIRTGGNRVERIAERLELETRYAWGDADLQARRAALEKLREGERTAAKEVERLRGEHNEARLQAFSARKEREERERGVARIREEARLCSSELAEIAADLEEAVETLAEVEKEVVKYREAAAGLEAKAAERAAAARAVEVDRTTVREELHDLKVRMARGAEQFESLRQAAARAERELVDGLTGRAALELDLERVRARAGESKLAAERLRVEAAAFHKDKGEREARFKVDQAALAELARKLNLTRAAEADADAQRTRAEAIVVQADRESREAAVRLEELGARLRDELSIELASLDPLPDPKQGAPAEAGAGRRAEPAFSEAQAEREVGSLRRQMEEIGPVNLEALEECERLAARRKTLAEQVRDIEGAEENLKAAIRKINETSRKRFLETFEAVRENFQHIFRKLFGGGKADLQLEEGKDVLEAGVEVTARPPGKEARTLTLLSGGEKVLTTVALLFAVFRSKPGPFCILDEVDAALDEHNVGRFVTLVREFLDRSQFLIVTHNKRTMKAADALYGVTMPEQGVSAPVSVRLGGAVVDAVEPVAAAHSPVAAA